MADCFSEFDFSQLIADFGNGEKENLIETLRQDADLQDIEDELRDNLKQNLHYFNNMGRSLRGNRLLVSEPTIKSYLSMRKKPTQRRRLRESEEIEKWTANEHFARACLRIMDECGQPIFEKNRKSQTAANAAISCVRYWRIKWDQERQESEIENAVLKESSLPQPKKSKIRARQYCSDYETDQRPRKSHTASPPSQDLLATTIDIVSSSTAVATKHRKREALRHDVHSICQKIETLQEEVLYAKGAKEELEATVLRKESVIDAKEEEVHAKQEEVREIQSQIYELRTDTRKIKSELLEIQQQRTARETRTLYISAKLAEAQELETVKRDMLRDYEDGNEP